MPSHSFSPTDTRILALALCGYTAKETAARTGQSPQAVESRLRRIRKRLHAKSLPHLAYLVGKMNIQLPSIDDIPSFDNQTLNAA